MTENTTYALKKVRKLKGQNDTRYLISIWVLEKEKIHCRCGTMLQVRGDGLRMRLNKGGWEGRGMIETFHRITFFFTTYSVP